LLTAHLGGFGEVVVVLPQTSLDIHKELRFSASILIRYRIEWARLLEGQAQGLA
jgi:hypothetical protein